LANARPAAIVSVEFIKAVPSAPGNNCSTRRARQGREQRLRDHRLRAHRLYAKAVRPDSHDAAIPAPESHRPGLAISAGVLLALVPIPSYDHEGGMIMRKLATTGEQQ